MSNSVFSPVSGLVLTLLLLKSIVDFNNKTRPIIPESINIEMFVRTVGCPDYPTISIVIFIVIRFIIITTLPLSTSVLFIDIDLHILPLSVQTQKSETKPQLVTLSPIDTGDFTAACPKAADNFTARFCGEWTAARCDFWMCEPDSHRYRYASTM